MGIRTLHTFSRDNHEWDVQNLFDEGLDGLAREHIKGGDFDEELKDRLSALLDAGLPEAWKALLAKHGWDPPPDLELMYRKMVTIQARLGEWVDLGNASLYDPASIEALMTEHDKRHAAGETVVLSTLLPPAAYVPCVVLKKWVKKETETADEGLPTP